MIRLRQTNNKEGVNREILLEAHMITIGRQPAEVSLDLSPDKKVSRIHARITWIDGDNWIEDIGSSLGTFVNTEKLEGRRRLQEGDVIRIGDTTLEVLAKTITQELASASATELETEGIISDIVNSNESPGNLLIPSSTNQEEWIRKARNHLSAFYELGTALGFIRTLDELSEIIVSHLRQAIPAAEGSGLMLLQDGELTLQMYLPDSYMPMMSMSQARRALQKREAFIWRQQDATLSQFSMSVLQHDIQSAIYAPLHWNGIDIGVVFISNSSDSDAFEPDDVRLLTALGTQSAMFIRNFQLQSDLQYEENVRNSLLRHFSPQIAERLLKNPQRRIGGEQIEPVTILVSDIRGFTTMSASMNPTHVMDMLNQVFGIITPIIFKYHGTVDKYIGDAVMAIFGCPEQDDLQCLHAVQAALDMQAEMNKIVVTLQSNFGVSPEIGIAVHTGVVVHGFLGSEERLEYTVIGDTVNKASRLCDLAEKGKIVVSRSVYDNLKDAVLVEPELLIKPSKHPETEPPLEGFVVTGLKSW